MRVLIQRVLQASVVIDAKEHAAIRQGLLVLLGIEHTDTKEDIDWLCRKLISLRVYSDADGKMNLDIKQVNGDILLVSQFTLHASTVKGNRPSYIRAARPEQAIPLYEQFINELSILLEKPVKTGVFGADMKVSLINDGPVTIWMDSKQRE